MTSDKAQNILFNTSALVAANFLSRLLSVPVAALVVRVLTEQEFGQYAYLLAFVGLFSPFVAFGMPSYLARAAIHEREHFGRSLKSAYLLQTLFSVITILLILVIGKGGELLSLAAVGMVGTAGAYLFFFTFSGIGRAYLTALIQAGTSLAGTLATLAVVIFIPSVEALLWIFASIGVLQHLLGYWVFRRSCTPLAFATGWPSFKDYKEVFLASLPYLFLVVFTTLYFRVDIALLEAWSTLQEVARYAAVYKFLEIVLILVGIFGEVFFAEFSRLAALGSQDTERLLRRGFRYMVFLSLPIAALMACYAQEILLLFYGDKYLQSVPLMQVIAWTTVFLFARNLQGSLLQSHNYVRIQVLVFGISSLLNIGLNYVLIPHQGALGASFATLLCEIFNFIALTWFVYSKFNILLVGRWLLPLGAGFLGMLSLFWLCKPIWLGLPLGLSAFIGLWYVCGGLQSEDANLWSRLLGKFGVLRA